MADLETREGWSFVPPRELYGQRLAGKEALKRWRFEQRAQTAAASLAKNGFEALYVPGREAARAEILARVPANAAVGVGGSITIRELEVLDVLRSKGHTCFDHWTPGMTQEELLACRRAQLTSDVFLSSVNAVTLQGQLVSTDGVGNRVAAMVFGPPKVILVAGAQKIVSDLDAAFKRVKDVCAPLALRDTAAQTPCVQTGVCGHCKTGVRMCRATLILEAKPMFTDVTVLIVGEELGF